MDKTVTLVAKTIVPCDGERYGVGMQFRATQADADRLIASGEAALAPEKRGAKTEQSPGEPAPQ